MEYFCEQGKKDGIALRGPHLDDAPRTRVPLGSSERTMKVGHEGYARGAPEPPVASAPSLHLLMYRLNEMTHSKVLATVRPGVPASAAAMAGLVLLG